MNIVAPKLKSHFQYKKFRGPSYRIIFLTFDYFLQAQLISELERRGHQVFPLSIPTEQAVKATLHTILTKATDLRPDAIMSLNSLGFDSKGQVINILSELGIPVIIWYQDNHLFDGPYFQDRTPDWAIAFTYERTALPTLREVGYQHTYYLPLATDSSICEGNSKHSDPSIREKVTFVGTMFAKAVKRYYHREFKQLLEDWNIDFTSIKRREGSVNPVTILAPFRDRFDSDELYYHFMASVVVQQTRRHRLAALKALRDSPLAVFGPDDWLEHIPSEIFYGPVEHGPEAARVFRSSGVNLSLTTFQQETALNQRYFDVPLCGGFLLSEWQDAVADHFDPESEVATFTSIEELQDKSRYYLRHPAARDRIVEKARRRVESEHLIEHRITTILDTVKGLVD